MCHVTRSSHCSAKQDEPLSELPKKKVCARTACHVRKQMDQTELRCHGQWWRLRVWALANPYYSTWALNERYTLMYVFSGPRKPSKHWYTEKCPTVELFVSTPAFRRAKSVSEFDQYFDLNFWLEVDWTIVNTGISMNFHSNFWSQIITLREKWTKAIVSRILFWTTLLLTALSADQYLDDFLGPENHVH